MGSRFTVVYKFCGITFVCYALSFACIVVGAWSLQLRVLGLCGACFMGCVSCAALITTAVFRFNTMGKLASLSTCPTKFDASAPNFASDKRTYSSDAGLILGIWIA